MQISARSLPETSILCKDILYQHQCTEMQDHCQILKPALMAITHVMIMGLGITDS